jgi:gamma-glutamyltranspeptidase/glutathione hydrolase
MTRGIIVAPQPEAVEVGAEILRDGGTAVDAAIACALVQGVVDPQQTGIAGFGSMQLFLPARAVHTTIDFHATAPAAARADMWEPLVVGETPDGFGFILKDNVNDVGYQSIAVPGSLKAYYEAQAEFGSFPWKTVIAPAIAHAEGGVIVRPHMNAWWNLDEGLGRVHNTERMRFSRSGRAIYFGRDGRPLPVGARLTNPNMARTLRRIADGGADTFYKGELAEEIADDMRRHGGLITKEDLASYRTTRSDPLISSYRSLRLATNRPPGGGIMLVEMLNILGHFDLTSLGHNSAEYIRIVAEAMKSATIDKDTHVGDPQFFDVPIELLTSASRAAETADRIAARQKANVERLNYAFEPSHTTHISVLDEHGNAVSMTHSLGSPSGVITDGLGFMYNGCMGVFDPRPGRAGSLAPGKRRFSSMAPSILFEGKDPKIVIGAPGGTQIAMGILQTILNLVDFRMSAVEAVSAPRFSATHNAIEVCNRIPRFVTDPLKAEGYVIARSPHSYTFAGVHVIKRDKRGWSGGADPSYDGMVLTV